MSWIISNPPASSPEENVRLAPEFVDGKSLADFGGAECSGISDYGEKDRCIMKLAIRKTNDKICDFVSDRAVSFTCALKVFQQHTVNSSMYGYDPEDLKDLNNAIIVD